MKRSGQAKSILGQKTKKQIKQGKDNRKEKEQQRLIAKAEMERLKGLVEQADQSEELVHSGSGLVELDEIPLVQGAFEEIAKPSAQPKKAPLYAPQSKPHVDFLAASEDEVLFSGGRGSGKSMALIVDPLQFCDKKKFRALFLRNDMPRLRDLITRAKDLYPQVFPGVQWKSQENTFIFPSGARIEFGYCQNMDDLERYRGQEYTWLGIDELTQFESHEVISKMKASMRTTDPTIPIYVRATTNPTGVGRLWVKERFVDLGPAGKTIVLKFDTPLGEMKLTRKWIQSTVFDNPALLKARPQYLAELMSLPEELREQWLHGSWDSAEGLAFPEFKRSVHTCDPFEIPSNWMRFRSCDWGYGRSLAVCHWFAIDPSNGQTFIYRELVANGDVPYTEKLNAKQFARKVLQMEAGETIRYGVIDGKTVARKSGSVEPTIEEQMREIGCRWKHADQSKGARAHGKMIFHDYLAKDEFTGEPRLKIFNHCTQIIKELSSLPLDENNPEDVDTDACDHAYDSARYGLMSRPHRRIPMNDPWSSMAMSSRPIIVDSTFGY